METSGRWQKALIATVLFKCVGNLYSAEQKKKDRKANWMKMRMSEEVKAVHQHKTRLTQLRKYAAANKREEGYLPLRPRAGRRCGRHRTAMCWCRGGIGRCPSACSLLFHTTKILTSGALPCCCCPGRRENQVTLCLKSRCHSDKEPKSFKQHETVEYYLY